MMRDQTDIQRHAGTIAPAWTAALVAVQVSGHAPLSARHALHAAVLIDQLSDIAFPVRGAFPVPALVTAGDLSAFRAGLRDCERSLGDIMDLTACGANAPRLEVRATAVAPEEFSALPVADLMVSLYNDGTVPRLMLVQLDGGKQQMQHLLQAATHWWSMILGN